MYVCVYSCHSAGESGLKKSRCVHCQAVNQGVKQEVSEFFGIIISTTYYIYIYIYTYTYTSVSLYLRISVSISAYQYSNSFFIWSRTSLVMALEAGNSGCSLFRNT